MIGIVTLNPCIDKTLFFDKIPSGGVNISENVFVQAGGKGINVARILKSCGVEFKVFTMIAGETGEYFKRLLEEEGISAEYCTVSGMTRTYTTLADTENRQIAFKEKGPNLNESEVEKVTEAFSKFVTENEISLLCLSDTIACCALTDFYAKAVEYAKSKGITVLLDADKEALRLALDKNPDIIKPNMDEYAEIIGKGVKEIDFAAAVEVLFEKGISNPIISLGEDGAMFFDGKKAVHGVAENVNYVNAVGCGDSFIGGLIYGIAKKFTQKERMRYALAAGAANCESPFAARISLKEIENKLCTVRFENVDNKN